MNMNKGIIAIISLVAAVALCGVLPAVTAFNDGGHSQRPNPPAEETFGNCLSLPVIWSDGVTKDLRGDPGTTKFEDDWWYHWGNEEDGTPLSCKPEYEMDPDDNSLIDYCDDLDDDLETIPCARENEIGKEEYCEDWDDDSDTTSSYNESGGYILLDPPGKKSDGNKADKIFLQQQENNTWQAESLNAAAENLEVHVDLIDWGDNLEAVSWNEYSVLRTEVVLFQDLSKNKDFPPMQGFKMDWLFGRGMGELWGTNTKVYDSDIATVYSGCARWTIQKLDDSNYVIENPGDIKGNLSLDWNATIGEWEGDISETYFNGAVWEAGDGPGYYSAEINVGGKVIYGYNWFVRDIDKAPGFYRLTFSLDSNCPELNTFFTESITEIVEFEIVEEVTGVTVADEIDSTGDSTSDGTGDNSEDNDPNDGEDSNNPGNLIPGGKAEIDFVNNLTYMDIQILEK
jgi:hypothetical protein